ncbi:MAG TPA: site-2 protease family protein, partial [Candidatus Angelobacter sp.]
MELAAETKLNTAQHYSPTSTPVLDVFRPLPPQSKDSLSAGEYFLASSLAILILVALPSLRAVIEIAPGYWAALIPVVAALSSGFTHEMGHLVAGWFAGFRLKQFKIGALPLGRHTRCGEPYCGDVVTLGAAVLEPRMSDQDDATLPRRLFLLTLGGPVASILLAGGLETVLYFIQPGFVVAFSLHVAAV